MTVWSRRQPGLQQGEVQAFQPVGGPSAWTAADYKNNEQWIYRLNEEDVQELERAVNSIIDSGVRVQVRNDRLVVEVLVMPHE